MGFHYLGQAGLELLTSGNPSASASQSAGITGVSHCPANFLYHIFYYPLESALENTTLVSRLLKIMPLINIAVWNHPDSLLQAVFTSGHKLNVFLEKPWMAELAIFLAKLHLETLN